MFVLFNGLFAWEFKLFFNFENLKMKVYYPLSRFQTECLGILVRCITLYSASPQWPYIIYIIGLYNPSVRIIDLVSYITYVASINFKLKWRDLQYKVDFERQIFLKNFSWQFYLLSEFLPEICWEDIADEILFVFCFVVWPGTRSLALRLISQHTTY